MKHLNLFLILAGIFILAFVVSVAIKFLYTLIIHGTGVFGWQSAFQLSLTLAIVITTVQYFERKKQ